ncbi:MAG: NAD(P)H-dependent glycerol-3-phosphate dehydrogenase [Opitutales bacterium]
MNVCIYPSGAWGTAMALQLVRRGHTVTLVPREVEEAVEMSTQRENTRFLPGYELPADLQISAELGPALMEAELAIIACPSKFLRSVCRETREVLEGAQSLRWFITLCKGLEVGSNALPYDILAEELPGFHHGVLSGPTFASQVAQGQPSALVLGTPAPVEQSRRLQEVLSGQNLRVYTSDDPVGVQLGGSLKNVYAIASGMCDGLGLGDNSRAALLTRSLHELVRLGETLGGRRETFYGLSGLGDLVLTCNGQESRNRTFGELFAQGVSIEELIEKRQMTVEGYRTCACFHAICAEKGIEAPILEQIYRILYEGQDLSGALAALMGRDLKSERA